MSRKHHLERDGLYNKIDEVARTGILTTEDAEEMCQSAIELHGTKGAHKVIQKLDKLPDGGYQILQCLVKYKVEFPQEAIVNVLKMVTQFHWSSDFVITFAVATESIRLDKEFYEAPIPENVMRAFLSFRRFEPGEIREAIGSQYYWLLVDLYIKSALDKSSAVNAIVVHALSPTIVNKFIELYGEYFNSRLDDINFYLEENFIRLTKAAADKLRPFVGLFLDDVYNYSTKLTTLYEIYRLSGTPPTPSEFAKMVWQCFSTKSLQRLEDDLITYFPIILEQKAVYVKAVDVELERYLEEEPICSSDVWGVLSFVESTGLIAPTTLKRLLKHYFTECTKWETEIETGLTDNMENWLGAFEYLGLLQEFADVLVECIPRALLDNFVNTVRREWQVNLEVYVKRKYKLQGPIERVIGLMKEEKLPVYHAQSLCTALFKTASIDDLRRQAKLLGSTKAGKFKSKEELCKHLSELIEQFEQTKTSRAQGCEIVSITGEDFPKHLYFRIQEGNQCYVFNIHDLMDIIKNTTGDRPRNPYTNNPLPVKDIKKEYGRLQEMMTSKGIRRTNVLEDIKTMPVLTTKQVNNQKWAKLSQRIPYIGSSEVFPELPGQAFRRLLDRLDKRISTKLTETERQKILNKEVVTRDGKTILTPRDDDSVRAAFLDTYLKKIPTEFGHVHLDFRDVWDPFAQTFKGISKIYELLSRDISQDKFVWFLYDASPESILQHMKDLYPELEIAVDVRVAAGFSDESRAEILLEFAEQLRKKTAIRNKGSVFVKKI